MDCLGNAVRTVAVVEVLRSRAVGLVEVVVDVKTSKVVREASVAIVVVARCTSLVRMPVLAVVEDMIVLIIKKYK